MESLTTTISATKKFKCPHCGTITSYTGIPGQQHVITCPSCGLKGRIHIPANTSPSTTTTNEVAIEISHLKKMFGDLAAVDDISFSVKRGEIFGLLGPNGAGKSTTIRMLCTLSRPTGGSATVAGYDIVKEDSKVRQHIGLVSEKMIMYDELTARENLKLFGRLYNLSHRELNERIDELLRFVKMEKWADHRIGTFSTGMKQRINVIRALINQPRILFLDEPTLGLDPQSTSAIRELIRKINREQGTTIILTTHMMVEADMLCERIGIIDYGKIVALDTPANLKKIVSGTDDTVVEVEIQNLQPSMLSATKSLEMVQSLVQEDGTHIKIHAKGKEAFDRIIDTLRDKGAKISMVKNIQPSLEDVFLHLTGRQVREKTAENNDQSRRGRGGWRQQRAARVR